MHSCNKSEKECLMDPPYGLLYLPKVLKAYHTVSGQYWYKHHIWASIISIPTCAEEYQLIPRQKGKNNLRTISVQSAYHTVPTHTVLIWYLVLLLNENLKGQ